MTFPLARKKRQHHRKNLSRVNPMPPACSRKKDFNHDIEPTLDRRSLCRNHKKEPPENLYVRVHPPDGKVTVSAPLHYPDQKIISFVLQKLPRIKASQERIRSEFRHAFREYISEKRIIFGVTLICLRS